MSVEIRAVFSVSFMALSQKMKLNPISKKPMYRPPARACHGSLTKLPVNPARVSNTTVAAVNPMNRP